MASRAMIAHSAAMLAHGAKFIIIIRTCAANPPIPLDSGAGAGKSSSSRGGQGGSTAGAILVYAHVESAGRRIVFRVRVELAVLADSVRVRVSSERVRIVSITDRDGDTRGTHR